MSLTPEQIAKAALKGRRGRGRIFNARNIIWKWLQSTSWFESDYPEIYDQVNLVDEVEKIVLSNRGHKAAETRRKNKKREKEKKKREEEASRQSSFDFDT